MNKEQIWGVLECCLLASDEADINYLIDKGFAPVIAKAGIKLLNHLKSIGDDSFEREMVWEGIKFKESVKGVNEV